jgi:hypothetical protein
MTRRTPAEMQTLAEQLRALVASGLTVSQAGAKLGLKRDVFRNCAERFGIKADPKVIRAAMGAGGAACRGPAKAKRNGVVPARKPKAPQREMLRNPKLSAVQQAALNKEKRRISGIFTGRAKMRVVPMNNADALIAEAVAAGKVTRCPPAAPMQIPNNAGAGWR